MKKLTIIIPHLNEKNEIIETIRSIRETSDMDMVNIISIDDCSSEPVNLDVFPNVKQIKNEKRMGVDFSRHLGVEMSDTKYCMVIDGHMRFKHDDWANKIINYVDAFPQSLFCTTCIGLGYGTTDMNNHKGKYFAADLKLFTEKEKNRPCRQIIEPVWTSEKPGQEYPVACILGANYFFNREWFLYIGGLRGLKSWGSSEPKLSICSYLAGGDCRITKAIEIGHLFRDNAPYATNICDLVYNKIYILKTIFPPELEEKLTNYIPKDINFKKAMEMIINNRDEIEKERKYYQSICKKNIYDFCNEFRVQIPE